MNWLLTGNGETDPSQHFLGTTDEKPINIKTNGVERVTVTDTGNVGIGVHEPRTLFHVLGRFATGLDHESAGTVTFFPPDGFGWFHIDNGPAGGRETGRLRISCGKNPGDLEYVSIQQDGNVGIGVPEPRTALHVRGRIATGSNQESAGAVTLFSPDFGTPFHIDNGPQSGGRTIARLRISGGENPGDAEFVSVQQDGNVGIGVITPEYKLDVAGIVHADDVVITSDARLKTNVTQLSGVLEKLIHIRGISFDWNELAHSARRSPERKQIGILAQELEAVYPELVTSAGAEDYRAIDYVKLSAVLVEAIKELKSDTDMRLRVLEAELAAQRTEIDRLRTENVCQ